MHHSRMPAEWARHEAVWIAWPRDEEVWGGADLLTQAREEWLGLAAALAAAGERVEILCPAEEADLVHAGLQAHHTPRTQIRLHPIPYDDIWLRDSGPLFLTGPHGLTAISPRFNGWGERFPHALDAQVGAAIAEITGHTARRPTWVLEGGALDVDGLGTALTTRDCLLNPNRWHPEDPAPQTEVTLEARLHDLLGLEHIIWLDGCLQNDHTDGHIDTLARFIGPGRVVCMRPTDPDDADAPLLAHLEASLRTATTANGQPLEVHTLPAPTEALGPTGERLPATYCNFYIANEAIILPTYGLPTDEAATAALQALWPDRPVWPRPSRALLSQGGAFHCLTQQQPLAAAESGGLQ